MCNLRNWLFSLGPSPSGFIPEEVHFDNRNPHVEMVNIYRTRRPSLRHWAPRPVSRCRSSSLCNATQLPPRARGGPSPGSETTGARHTVARSWLEPSRGTAPGLGGIRGLAGATHLRTPPFPTADSYHGSLAQTHPPHRLGSTECRAARLLGHSLEGRPANVAKCRLSPLEPITRRLARLTTRKARNGTG